MAALIERRGDARFRLAIDAVSTHKAMRLPNDLKGVDLLFMNIDEANAVLNRQGSESLADAADAAIALRERGVAEAIVTMGARGMAVASATGTQTFAAIPAKPVDMTGAGDAMIAGTLSGLLGGQDVFASAATARCSAHSPRKTPQASTPIFPTLPGSEPAPADAG